MFGATVTRLTTFGTKDTFTADELGKLAKLAEAPVRWFDTREAAAERFLLVAGLVGLVDPGAPVVKAGITQDGERWRLTADNATVRVAGPPLADMVAMCRAPMRLGRGSKDPAVTRDALRAFDPEMIEYDGCGHNPHVEAPAQVAAVVRELHLGDA
jgi:pimeloyl-ACP methyl ester carboxylesterase